MSLSRPVKFPLLKLPLLCIESVIRTCDFSVTIFLALTSRRTRQIVKYVSPLTRIRIFLSESKWIEIGRNSWYFTRTDFQSPVDENQNLRKMPLLLENNAIPLYTRKTDYGGLESYTNENEFIALKMALKFLNEAFKCSIERVQIDGDNFPEAGDVGVKSAVNLCIDHDIVYAQSRKLNLLLENLEVTDTCIFRMRNIENGFYCDPKLFKCKKLLLSSDSTTWLTREILMQLEVPQLNINDRPFSVDDIVSFVTQWFHSNNRKFEYLYISAHNRQLSLVSFQTDHLNSLPFNGRNRMPSSEPFSLIDFSTGLELRRNDGLAATIHDNRGEFLFYVWHNQ